MRIDWTAFKVYLDRGLSAQEVTAEDDQVKLEIYEGPVYRWTRLHTESAEWTEYTTNYQSNANAAVRTATQATALPEPEDYRFRGDKSPWTVCASGTTNIDMTPSATEDRYLDGGVVITHNANPGDWVKFQVVHPIAGVVEEFVPGWYVIPGDGRLDIQVYRAKIPAGLILRVVYTNAGTTDAEIGINFRLHKKGV